jgi:long-chain acyl-CoA synthetase
MNLHNIFRDTAKRQPGHPAILGPGPRAFLSYAELAAEIDTVAKILINAGLRHGDCVGLHWPSGPRYIILTYAVWQAGGSVVPIPVELTDTEKQEVLRTICIQFVIAEGDAAFVGPYARGYRTPLPGRAGFVAVTPGRDDPPGFRAVNSAFIRFTSGTTGAFKGVVLSHQTIRDRIDAANDALHIGPDDRVVWLLSMSYHFAVSIVSYLSFGAAVVLPANHLAATVIGAINKHQGTLIYGSPLHYDWLANSELDQGLPTLRLAISTAAPLNVETAARFQTRFGVPVSQALGIIEVGLPFINVDFAAKRSNAVGRLLPAYRLQMRDIGLGPDLKEVWLSGKGFLDAYYEPWQPRKLIMQDGWFRTGDVGELDPDGCLVIRGRAKDIINVMGMKFFPQEVEAVLTSHPSVAGARVFAESDARLGETPIAQVIAKQGSANVELERSLLELCRTRLAQYKIPGRIEFVAALPRTASGKLLHRVTSQRPEGCHDESTR